MTVSVLNRRAVLRFGVVTVVAPQALVAAGYAPERLDAAHALWTQ